MNWGQIRGRTEICLINGGYASLAADGISVVADTPHQWWPVTAPNGERGWRCERCGLTAVRLTEKLWHAPCDAPPCAPSDNGTVSNT